MKSNGPRVRRHRYRSHRQLSTGIPSVLCCCCEGGIRKFDSVHTGVENASPPLLPATGSRRRPCAVCVCLHCIGDEHRLSLYRDFTKMVPQGAFAIFERGAKSDHAARERTLRIRSDPHRADG